MTAPDPQRRIETIRSYLASSSRGGEMAGLTRAEKVQWITQLLDEVRYECLSKADKGIVRQYAQAVTGYSRAQIERHISAYRERAAGEKPAPIVAPVIEAAAAPVAAIVAKDAAPLRDAWLGLSRFAWQEMRSTLVPLLLSSTTLVLALALSRFAWPVAAPLLVLDNSPSSSSSPAIAMRWVTAPERIPVASVTPAPQSGPGTSVGPRVPLRASAPAQPQKPETVPTQIEYRKELVATLMNISGNPAEGQVVFYHNGKAVWGNLPAELISGAPPGGAGPLRRGGGGGGGGGESGGGGGVTNITNTTQNVTNVTNVTNTTTGLSQSDADARYVNTFGDSMTGALVILASGQGLTVSGTTSGSSIHAEHLLTSSGTFVSGGPAVFESSMRINGVTYTFPYSDGAASGTILSTDGAGHLSWTSLAGSTGISQAAADARYVNVTGDAMTGGLFIGSAGTIDPGLLLEIAGTASGRVFHAQNTLSSSGTLVVSAGVTFENLQSCTNLQTASNGALSCNNAQYLATSTGALATAFKNIFVASSTGALSNSFKNIFLASSTGALKANFGSQFVQSSTGSLKTFFDSLYFRSSTGSLANAFKSIFLASSTGSLSNAFKNIYVASSTGSLKTYFDGQYFRTSTGSLANAFKNIFVASSTGSLKTYFDSLYFRTSTGSLSNAFKNIFLASSTGSLSNAFKNIYVASSTGSLKTYFDGQYFRSSTGSLANAFKSIFLASSTGSLSNAFKNIYVASSTGSLKTYFDSLYFRSSTGALANSFKNIFLASSTGSLSNAFKNIYVASSTGSLKTYFDGQYFRSSTGSLSNAFKNIFLASSTGSLSNAFKNIYVASSTGSLKTYFDSLYFRSSTGSLKTYFDAQYFRSSTGALQNGFDKRYVNAAGDTMTGGLLIVNGGHTNLGTADAGVLLEIAGTASGRILRAQDTLASSGTLSVNGAATFGSTVRLGGVTYTFPASDGSASGKILATDGAGHLSWTTDQNTGNGGTGNFGTGNVLTIGNNRYVKKQGDTMTGGLLIVNGGHTNLGTADAGVLLEVAGTMSGRVMHAQDQLQSSGSLVVRSASFFESTLGVRGTLSGAALTVSNLRNCNTIDTDASGNLVCGIDEGGGSGLTLATGDQRYVKKQGDTMTGGLLIQNTVTHGALPTIAAGLLLNVSGTASGDVLHAQRRLESSGSLTVDGTVTLKNTANCVNLQTSSNGALSCNNAQYLATSTGSLANAFKSIFLASSTGSLSNAFKNIYVASSTGSLKTYFDALYFRSSTGSLSNAFKNIFLASSTGSLSNAFKNIFVASSTGSLKTYFDGLYFRSSTGSLKTYFDTLYQPTGSYLTSVVAGQGLTKIGTNGLALSANISGSLIKFQTVSGTTLQADSQLRSSGSLTVNGTTTLKSLVSCTNLQTSSNGALSCNNAQYLATSTGALANAFKSIFLASSTGSLSNAFKNIFLASSTGSLSNAFKNIYIASSTGSLKTYFDGLYFRSSTGSLSNAFKSIFLASSTGSLSNAFKNIFVASSTGSLQTYFNSLYFRSSTGALQNGFDKRYVNAAGDTMTGGLLIQNTVTHGALPTIAAGLLLNVSGTASGDVLHAQRRLESSGSLTVDGTVTLKNTANCTNLQTSSNGALSCNNAVYLATSTGSLATAFKSIFLASSTGSLSNAFKNIYIASSTGSLSNAFKNIFVASSTGSLQTYFNGLYFRSSTGALQNGFDKRYVNAAGDTMTGGLLIQSGTVHGTLPTIDAGLLLEVAGTMSGRTLHAQDALESSGTLVVRGAGLVQGNLTTRGTLSGAALTVMRGTSYLLGNVGIGETSPKTSFEVQGTISGSTVYATKNLLASGSLVVDGIAILKSTLKIGGVTYTFPTSDGTASGKVLKTDGAGHLSWSTDLTGGGTSNFSSGNVLTIGNNRYTLKQGDTMTGGLLIQNTVTHGALPTIAAGLLLNVSGTASGDVLHAQRRLESSGSLTVDGTVTLKNTANCVNLQTSSNGALSCNNAQYLATSTGSLANAFKSIFLASSTGSLSNAFKNIYVASSTGSLKTYFDGLYFRSSTGSLANAFKNIFVASSTGSLKTYFDGLYFRSSTGSLKAYFDTLYQPTGSYLTSVVAGQGLTKIGTNGLALSANISGSLLKFQTVSGTILQADSQLRSSGSLTVNGTTTLKSLVSCTNLQTSSNGALSCNNAVYLATSTGSLATAFKSIFLASSTGSLSNAFKNIFLASSTGSLSNAFKNIYVASSTGSLSNAFKNIFVASSTGSLQTYFNNQYFRSSTGALQNGFDKRYVNTSGDTMTGGLLIQSGTLHGTLPTIDAGLLLEIAGTASGRTLHAQDALESSGTLVVRGTGLVQGNFTTRGTLSGAVLTVMGGTSYLLGNVGIGETSPKTKLEVLGTISGSTVFATNNLLTSGSLVVGGAAILKSTLKIGGVTYTFPTSDGTASGKVLKTDGAGHLSWSTDLTTSVGTFSSGNVLAIGNARYVLKQGDTMTGGLLIQSGTVHGALPTIDAGLLLEIAGTASGRTLHAQDALESSGTLVVRGAGLVQGNLTTRGTLSGAALTVMGGKSYFLGNLGIGLTNPTTPLEVNGTMSGSLLVTTNVAGINLMDGSLSVHGTAGIGTQQGLTTNSVLQVGENGGSPSPFDLIDGPVGSVQGIANAPNVHVTANSAVNYDNYYGAGILQLTANLGTYYGYYQDALTTAGTGTLANSYGLYIVKSTVATNHYGAYIGDKTGIGTATPGSMLVVSGSMLIGNNVGSISADAGLGLEIIGTASGRTLHAQDALESSGTLVVRGAGLIQGNLTTRGTLSGAALTIMRGNSYLLGNVGIGTANAAKTKLEIQGVGSGSELFATSKLSTSGSLVVGGAVTFKNIPSCASIQSSSNGALSCGSANNFGSGNVLTIGNNRYTLKQGDTMTGGLLIQNGVTHGALPTIDAGLLLEVAGTLSGRVLHAQDTISSSGTLVIKGTSLFQNNVTVRGVVSGSSLVVSGGTHTNSGIIIQRPSTGAFITMRDTLKSTSVDFTTGVGDPNTKVLAGRGSLFFASDSGKIWKNNDGNTQWVELATGSGTTHMAKIYRNAAQALGNGITQKIYMDTKEFDVGGIANVAAQSTGSGRITIKKAGRYLVTGSIYLAAGTTSLDQMKTSIFKNGSAIASTIAPDASNNLDLGETVTDVLNLTVGDYIELYVKQSMGGSRNTPTAADQWPRLSVIQIQDNIGNSMWTLSGTNLFNNNTGNIGIGVTTPPSKLSLSGAMIINATGNLARKGADAGLALEVIGAMSGRSLWIQDQVNSSGAVVIKKVSGTSTGNTLVVDTRGLVYDATDKRVGIGTATPGSALSVVGTSNAGVIASFTDANASLNFLQIVGASSSVLVGVSGTNAFMQTNTVGGKFRLEQTGGGLANLQVAVGSGKVLHADDLLSLSGSLVIRGNGNVNPLFMTDTANARIGIGTNAPNFKLTVSGSLSVKGPANTEEFRLNDSTNSDSVGLFTGKGTPNGNATAQLGSEYFDSQNGKLYVKAVGDGTNTGWRELQTTSGSLDMAKMTRNAAQSIPTATFQKLYFDTIEFDTNGLANVTPGATGSGRITIKKAGIYMVTANWGQVLAPTTQLHIRKNGGAIAEEINNSTDNASDPMFAEAFSFAVNDVIDMTVYQDSGSAQNTSTGTDKPRISVVQLNAVPGADIAELYGSYDQSISPGDLVVMDPTLHSMVKKSTSRYEAGLMGIVSTQPGMVLGGDYTPGSGAKLVILGLAGRVPVKVTTENGPIVPGDLLTSSSKPGFAMKALPGSGPIVGQALEAFDGTQASDGLIMAFINNSRASGGGNLLSASGTQLTVRSDLVTMTGALTVQGTVHFGSGVTIASHSTASGQTLLQISSDVGGSGNTVFRVTAGGDVSADGAFTGGGADYAEWFTTSTPGLQFGEAVCIDVTQPNSVRRCTSSGDPDIIGLVSSKKQAAFIGNKFSGAEDLPVPNTVLVGLLGQLSGDVVVESGAAIRPGDPLAAGTIPGTLRKALPGESTVGVALEPLDTGRAMRKVLISRKNQSITAEAVSERVLQTVQSLKIGDELKISLQSAMQNLSASGSFMQPIAQEVQKQLSAIDFRSVTDRLAQIENELSAMSGAVISGQRTTDRGTFASDHLSLSGALTADSLTLNENLTAHDGRFTGDLYVDGVFSVQDLYVPNAIRVDGALHAATLEIDSGATIHGALTLTDTLNVEKDMAFASGSVLSASDLLVRGALHALGPITIEGLASFLGDVQISGTLTVSNRQAGFAQIPMTGTAVTIVFDPPLSGEPVVTATPQTRVGSEWWTDSSSATGFTLHLADPAKADVRFAWTALAADTPLTTVGHAAAANAQLTDFPVDAQGVPVSSNDVWNSCIRNHPLTQSGGSPVNCDRYRSGYIWEQPDLHVSFVWNTSLTPPLLQLPDGYQAVTAQQWTTQGTDGTNGTQGTAVSSSSDSSSSDASISSSSESSVSSVSSASSETSSLSSSSSLSSASSITNSSSSLSDSSSSADAVSSSAASVSVSSASSDDALMTPVPTASSSSVASETSSATSVSSQ